MSAVAQKRHEGSAPATPVDPAYDYSKMPEGFYQDVIENGHPVRRAWHLQKFERVIECLPERKGQSILDIGCFAGTFLGRLDGEWFTRQVGVDIIDKQIRYANTRFASPFRRFETLRSMKDLARLDETFDCITLIEVIEHLREDEIRDVFTQVARLLKPGGKLVLSTPNYASTWPALELLVNAMSEFSYEEQHITKFTYFNAPEKLASITPVVQHELTLDFKTTTHFVAPFLAPLGMALSMRISRAVQHQHWGNPFGNLVMLRYSRVA